MKGDIRDAGRNGKGREAWILPRVLSCLEKGASRNLLSSAKLFYLQQLHPMDRDRLGPDFFPSREGPCGSDSNRMNVELFGWRHTEAKWQLLSSSTKPFRMKKELHFAERTGIRYPRQQ